MASRSVCSEVGTSNFLALHSSLSQTSIMLVTLGWLSLGVLAVSASALSTRQDATAPKSSLLTLPLFHYEDGSGFDQYSGGSYFGVNVTVG